MTDIKAISKDITVHEGTKKEIFVIRGVKVWLSGINKKHEYGKIMSLFQK